MHITIMGIALIPLAAIIFITKYEYLIYLAIFFSGFTGSSVVNIKDFSLQPSYLFFILFFIRFLPILIKNKKICKPNPLLLLLIFICGISLIMPIIVEYKKIIVLNPNNKYESIEFGIQNITQYMYLLFSFLVYWVVKDYTKGKDDKIKKITNISLYSSLFICILGMYQLVAYLYNLPYDEIFRQGINGNIQPYGMFIRVYAVAGEPSMYSIFIITSISICINIDKSIFKLKNILLILLFLNGIMTVSSTFFIGIILLLITKFKISMVINKNDLYKIRNFTLLLIVLCVIIFVMFKVNPMIKELIIKDSLEKLTGESLSSISRGYAFFYHINIGLMYPVLGVGFGSVRSYDLFSTWFSSIGIIGIVILFAFLINLILLKVKANDYKQLNIFKGYKMSIIITFILLFISVPEPYFLFIWINIAITENIYKYLKASN